MIVQIRYLTTGSDAIAPSADDSIVTGDKGTLTPGDALNGGDGYDVLSLKGGGEFNLSAVANFSGFEEVRVGASQAKVTLGDGVSLQIVISGAEGGSSTIILATGLQTIEGSASYDTFIASNQADIAGDIINGGDASDSLLLGGPDGYYDPNQGPGGKTPAVYDLTATKLTGIEELYLGGFNSPVTVKVNSETLRDVQEIYGPGTITTEEATLDLSGISMEARWILPSFRIESTRSTGTSFIVSNTGNFTNKPWNFIQGGIGHDTLVVADTALSDYERDYIFMNSSIETITDSSGTYAVPPPIEETLSSGIDIIDSSSRASIVTTTTEALNPEDVLDAGGGYDILKLSGAGSFDLTILNTFEGFEEVVLDESHNSYEGVELRDGVSLRLVIKGPKAFSVGLATGAQTIEGSEGMGGFYADRQADLQGDVIRGGAGRYDLLVLGNPALDSNPSAPESFDLTVAEITGIEEISFSGWGTGSTVKVNSQNLEGVRYIFGSGTVTTTDSVLDLSGVRTKHTYEDYPLRFNSDNGNGTTFIVTNESDYVDSSGIAKSSVMRLVNGGKGHDTLEVKGAALTAAERTEIFKATSIEVIKDSSGMYASDPVGLPEPPVVTPQPPVVTLPVTVDTTTSTVLSDGVFNLTAGGSGNIALTGNALDNSITGNKGENTINGGAGSDKLNGGLGNDNLTGGSGKDAFVFTTKLGTSKTDRKVNFDTLKDFSAKDDSLYLDNAIFKKLGKKGSEANPVKLDKKFLAVGDKAKDKDDYVIYNKKTGVLSYDADGSGKWQAVESAQLKKGLALKYTDFFVI